MSPALYFPPPTQTLPAEYVYKCVDNLQKGLTITIDQCFVRGKNKEAEYHAVHVLILYCPQSKI